MVAALTAAHEGLSTVLSDYYPEAPGGRPGGRSIEPKPFDARKLGPDEPGLEPPYGKVPLNVVVMQQDYVRLNMLKRHPRGVLRSLKVGARTMWAKATGWPPPSPRRSETTNRCSRACSWCRLSCAECESTENSLAAVISLSVALGHFVAMVDAQFLGADPRGTDLAALVAA